MLVNILNICSDDELGETEEEMTDESEGRQHLLECGDVVFVTDLGKLLICVGSPKTRARSSYQLHASSAVQCSCLLLLTPNF